MREVEGERGEREREREKVWCRCFCTVLGGVVYVCGLLGVSLLVPAKLLVQDSVSVFM